MINRKIKNARPTTYNGIKMRSKLEADFAVILDKYDLKWEYEPFKITILPGFKYLDWHGKFTQAVVYTPDFVINNDVIIEGKGWSNDAYPLRRKLLLKYLVDNDYPYSFYEVHTKTQLINLLKELHYELKKT